MTVYLEANKSWLVHMGGQTYNLSLGEENLTIGMVNKNVLISADGCILTDLNGSFLTFKESEA